MHIFKPTLQLLLVRICLLLEVVLSFTEFMGIIGFNILAFKFITGSIVHKIFHIIIV